MWELVNPWQYRLCRFQHCVYIVDILFNFKCNLLEFSLAYLASETSKYCTNGRFFFYLLNYNHNENSARKTTASYIKDSGNFATWSIFPSRYIFSFASARHRFAHFERAILQTFSAAGIFIEPIVCSRWHGHLVYITGFSLSNFPTGIVCINV